MIHIFIVNPYAGQKTFADDLRSKLKNIKGLNYFVFNTRYAGYETEIVKDILNIFEDEELRFYCCGGSGTFRNMINGFDNIAKAQIAFFPCGLTNDFLKVFGEDESRFYNVEELIYGDVIDIDYIKSNQGIMLNSFSTGLDSKVLASLEEYRLLSAFGGQIPYMCSVLREAFFANNREYIIQLDDKELIGRFSEIFFCNGYVFGGNMYFDNAADVTDGKGLYCLVPACNGFSFLRHMLYTIQRNIGKLHSATNFGYCSRIKIQRRDGKPFHINQDGDIFLGNIWEASIVRKGLHLVVPKGVKI